MEDHWKHYVQASLCLEWFISPLLSSLSWSNARTQGSDSACSLIFHDRHLLFVSFLDPRGEKEFYVDWLPSSSFCTIKADSNVRFHKDCRISFFTSNVFLNTLFAPPGFLIQWAQKEASEITFCKMYQGSSDADNLEIKLWEMLIYNISRHH